MTKIQIGCEEWSYEIEDSYTHIFDSNDEPALTLRWVATESEVKAAAYGFGAGSRIGFGAGVLHQQRAIMKALGVKHEDR